MSEIFSGMNQTDPIGPDPSNLGFRIRVYTAPRRRDRFVDAPARARDRRRSIDARRHRATRSGDALERTRDERAFKVDARERDRDAASSDARERRAGVRARMRSPRETR